MVQFGQFVRNSRKTSAARDADIVDIPFRPPASYALDVEVFTLARFRGRVSDAHLRRTQRVDFHIMIYFESGTCTHMIDFEPVRCEPGTLLVLQPGQVQRFDVSLDTWDGWIVMCGPQFASESSISANKEEMLDVPTRHHLHGRDREIVVASIERMHEDTLRAGDARTLDALLHHELAALFARLRLCARSEAAIKNGGGANAELFRRFRMDVKRNIATTHRVADYARMAGCSEKTLGRAVLAATGDTAKAYLSRRLTLEAKRLLANTTLGIAVVAERLGFDEPSNFVKFFRRGAKEAPGEFRRRAATDREGP